MPSTFAGSIRMEADQHHCDRRRNVRNRRQYADRQIAHSRNAANQRWEPQADTIRNCVQTEIYQGKDPDLEKARGCQNSFATRLHFLFPVQRTNEPIALFLGKPLGIFWTVYKI